MAEVGFNQDNPAKQKKIKRFKHFTWEIDFSLLPNATSRGLIHLKWE